MSTVTFAQATLDAMTEEMARDERVFVMGEDIARQGGIFGQFKGLADRFGTGRVMDTPISETAIVGACIGAALAGMRPVADMHFADFIGVCFDEVLNQMAKIYYMFGGQKSVPMVLRAPDGLVNQAAAQHSQSLEAFFLHIPGLKVVAPSNPADAKGLLKSAIRDDNPVIYFEHKALFSMKGEIPGGDHLAPIGKANVIRQGSDVTLVSWSMTMNLCIEAADVLAAEGIGVELIDLRTISPLDEGTILESVAKTTRLVIAHEAVKQGGVGAEIAAIVAEEAIDCLDAPIVRVGAPFTPVPFARPLERAYRVTPEKIASAVRSVM
ncbi:MAG: alpha-ketoacid dehydrogenase subunit beta [Synergistaceae bacterium]|nr:alpha-ketoacid dehydrogenase subunit beta [Synergistota bacterium]NLM72284.1 alpha-ketoacid dehydrogenase subunit beta [Synergistaceae bacterium]